MAWALTIDDYFSINSIAVVLKYIAQQNFGKNPVVLTDAERKDVFSIYNSGTKNGARRYADITFKYMDVAKMILYYPDKQHLSPQPGPAPM